MTTLTANYSGTTAGKFGSALRNIIARLVQTHELTATLPSASQDKVAGAAELNRMAKRFEASQPNLAAELRFIASRG